MGAPLFSVVIPTRNRPDVLRYALQCALAQRFDDFEVVVSDNGTSEATREVVADYHDPRIRYVKTPRPLHMVDSWDFALTHAAGRYVTFLSDDDGVSPALLEAVHSTLKESSLDIVSWPFAAAYHHDSSDEIRLRNTISFDPLDGRTEEVSRKSIFSEISAVRFTQKLPRLINSCAHRDVFVAIREKFGQVFFPACPDYGVGVAQLAVRPALAYLNDFFLLWGICGDSIGYSANKGGAAAQAFFAELQRDKVETMSCVPLKTQTTMNYAVDTILRVQAKDTENLREIEIDWPSYFDVIGHEILILEQAGADVTSDLARLSQALGKESAATRLRMSARLLPFRHMRRVRSVRNLVSAALSAVKRPLRPLLGRKPSTVLLKGAEAGFVNMFEAARKLDELRRQRRAS
jgi:glycosyltransferase involved in cell wall biosynthesis